MIELDQFARYLISSRVVIRPLHGRCALILLSRTHSGTGREQINQAHRSLIAIELVHLLRAAVTSDSSCLQ